MLWLLIAKDPSKLPIHGCDRVVFNCARGEDGHEKNTAKEFCKRNGLGSKGVAYKLEILADNRDDSEAMVAVQLMTPQIDPTAVAAAMQAPQGQRGANRPTGAVGLGGFQSLGDGDLPVAASDQMFGENDDGTYSDIVLSPMGSVEQPRPRDIPGYASTETP